MVQLQTPNDNHVVRLIRRIKKNYPSVSDSNHEGVEDQEGDSFVS